MPNEEVKCAVRDHKVVFYHPSFQEKWEEVQKFATSIGKFDNLQDAVSHAAFKTYFGREAKCFIHHDFAPHSLGFSIHVKRKDSTEYEHALSGGIIYYEPTGEWSVHT